MSCAVVERVDGRHTHHTNASTNHVGMSRQKPFVLLVLVDGTTTTIKNAVSAVIVDDGWCGTSFSLLSDQRCSTDIIVVGVTKTSVVSASFSVAE